MIGLDVGGCRLDEGSYDGESNGEGQKMDRRKKARMWMNDSGETWTGCCCWPSSLHRTEGDVSSVVVLLGDGDRGQTRN